MSEFTCCLMMAAIHMELTRMFAAGQYACLESLADGLDVMKDKYPIDELTDAHSLAVRMTTAFEDHGEDKVRRAHEPVHTHGRD